jgi:acetylornithine deacetylase/succinyl-diaminopimelate desuccinylase-like protein
LDVKITYGESVGDFNLFGKIMPTLVFGPSGGKWHSHDEFVNLESVLRCEKILGRFLETLPKLKKF